MTSREDKDLVLHSDSLGNLESIFLEEELFAREDEEEWEPTLLSLQGESLFLGAFEQEQEEKVRQREQEIIEPETEELDLLDPELAEEEVDEYQLEDETTEDDFEAEAHESVFKEALEEESPFLDEATVKKENLENESEVLGTKDMTWVSNTLDTPHRWICRLDIEYEITPWRGSRKLSGHGRGTGTLIGPCHVLTAAHNLTSYDPLQRNYLRAISIKVTPAHDGSGSPPIRTVDADLSKSHVHPHWMVSRRVKAGGASNPTGEAETNKYDYAVLILKSAIGNTQIKDLGEKLGYWGNRGSGGLGRLRRLAPEVLQKNDVFVAGYGSDACVRAVRKVSSNSQIPLGAQLKASGKLTLVWVTGKNGRFVSRSMAHNVDTCDGQSGAPVWIERKGVFDVVGIHTGAVDMTDGSRMNHAVRVTTELIQQVTEWLTKTPCFKSLGKAEKEEPLETEASNGEENLLDLEEEVNLFGSEEEAILEVEMPYREEEEDGALLEDIADEEDGEDEEEELKGGEHAHDAVGIEGENEDAPALETFQTSDVNEEDLEDGLWEAQVGSGGRPGDFKLELELNYGMEKAIGGEPQGFPFIPPHDRLRDDTVVTTHTKASDGFRVVMDGPRMEIETRRIGLEQPAELDRIMTNIFRFVRDLEIACGGRGLPRTVPASVRAGKVRDFHLPVFASPDFIAFPIKDSSKQRTWFRQNCRVWASPQCTIDVPLESVIAFVNELRRSQSREGARRWTGSSGSRAGLRSDALYHARDAVLKSFRAHSAAGRATNHQLTRKLAGFMILLVQYLRTSEMRYHKPDRPGDTTFTKPDAGSRDHERFLKAYVPLVVHTHFHEIFNNILSSSERTLFLSLYGDSAARQNLFDLALDTPGSKSGSAELFPARTRGFQVEVFGSVLTWDQLVDSAIDSSKPIRRLPEFRKNVDDLSLPTPLAKASKGGAKTGPAGARVDGVRLEMRRMGYRWWRPNEWRSMSRQLYQMARKLNGIS